jgi:hypothetical protein
MLTALSGCSNLMREETAQVATPAETPVVPTLVSLPVPPAPVLPPPPSEALPFEAAVERAAAELFASVPAGVRSEAVPQMVVIDPLVDGAAGGQTAATRRMEERLATFIKASQPDYDLRPLNTETISQSPLVLVGSVRGAGPDGLAPGVPQAYRIWFSLADLKTGTVVGHGMAWARTDGVNAEPTGFFRESPAWVVDTGIKGYLRTCLSKVGEPVDPSYLDGILAAALIADGI